MESGTVTVRIVKSNGPLGLSFIGPRGDEDTRVGNFVKGVAEGTPAADAGGLERGMRIVSVNGEDAMNITKSACGALFKVNVGQTVELVLRHDPEGFELFHSGGDVGGDGADAPSRTNSNADSNGGDSAERRQSQSSQAQCVALPQSQSSQAQCVTLPQFCK
jgi:predicted metalloprotease with PDZ domain